MFRAILAIPLASLAVTFAVAPIPLASEEAAPLSTDLPIETLMANEAAKAVVLKHLPGLDEHPAYGQMKAISLRAVMPYSQGRITEGMLDKIDAELKAL